MIEILVLINEREQKLKQLNFDVIEQRILDHDKIRLRVQQVARASEKCAQVIEAIQQQKAHLIGNTFIYEGLDYIKASRLEVIQVCDLLEKFNIKVDLGERVSRVASDLCTSMRNPIDLQQDQASQVRLDEGEVKIFESQMLGSPTNLSAEPLY